MYIAMFVVVFLLLLIASFGFGFILNMLTRKFPWTSSVVAIVIGGYFLIAFETYTTKLILSLPVIAGGIIATMTIRTLQRRGFKMFG
ncbi:hypothetical protein [Tumebacillus permanentifrigoris]|uniref:YesK-like protein n=1 Tax=Tumebacillus permanentifrigoris TaxID=378543 RepID=A0A316DEF8_9BACL|nr:hypothetical protein [Tumebacillus permanentifrigoris]PWK15932.1 hypothetical protein C7459_102178 [Tumebacillus permanentifrigoris]